MSSWPRPPNDSDAFMLRQLEAIFAEYPPSVTRAVTSPLTGMQRRAEYERFPPSVPQIVKELNREMEVFRRNAERAQAKRLRIEQEQIEKPPLNLEKYPEFFGPKRDQRKGFRTLDQIAKDCGVTQEQIDAIPNARRS